jgi:hypothetical protein
VTPNEKTASRAALKGWERFLDFCESAIYGFFKLGFVAGFALLLLAVVIASFMLHWTVGLLALWIAVGVTAAYFGK